MTLQQMKDRPLTVSQMRLVEGGRQLFLIPNHLLCARMLFMNMFKNERILGFFGFFALFALPGMLEGEWIQAVWLVWLIWFIYFFKKPKKHD